MKGSSTGTLRPSARNPSQAIFRLQLLLGLLHDMLLMLLLLRDLLVPVRLRQLFPKHIVRKIHLQISHKQLDYLAVQRARLDRGNDFFHNFWDKRVEQFREKGVYSGEIRT